MQSHHPIGVLDSGLGGLSVLRALRQLLPHEDFLYCADSGNAPWGDKSPEFIADRCDAIVRFLLDQGAKAVVLACNTATAIAAEQLRATYSVPIIGIEPAVKPAVKTTSTRKIGVLATTRTISSPRYASLLNRFAEGTHVISQPAPGLMECVERGEFDTPNTRSLLARYITPMLEAGVDTLVLGCTHYPFLTSTIKQLTGEHVQVIEPGQAVARVTRQRLEERHTLCTDSHAGHEVFYIKDAERYSSTLGALWYGPCTVRELNV